MSGTPLKDASARCPRGWRRTGAWPRRCSWGGVAGVAQILRVPTPGRLHVSDARLPRLCAPPGWCGTVGRLAGAARSAPRAQALQATGQWGRARRARRARWGAAPCTRSPHQERASGPHVGFPGASLPRASTRRPHGLAVQVPRMSAEGTCDGGMAIWTRLPPRVGRRPLGGDGRGDPRAGAPGGGASPSRLLHAGQAPSPGGPAPGSPCSCSRGRGSSPSRSASCCSTCQGRDGSSGASSSGPLCGGRSTGYGPRRTGPRWSGPRQPSGAQVSPEPPRDAWRASPRSSRPATPWWGACQRAQVAGEAPMVGEGPPTSTCAPWRPAGRLH
jgi:hypothetical protein